MYTATVISKNITRDVLTIDNILVMFFNILDDISKLAKEVNAYYVTSYYVGVLGHLHITNIVE